MDSLFSRKNIILINSVLLLAWCYFHIDLQKIDLFEKLGKAIPSRYLALALTLTIVYLTIDLVRNLLSGDADQQVNSRGVIATIFVALAAVVLSGVRIFGEFGIDGITTFSISFALAVGAACAMLSIMLVQEAERLVAFKLIRKRVHQKGLVAIAVLFGLILLAVTVFNFYIQRFSPETSISLGSLNVCAICLLYTLLRPSGSILEDATMNSFREKSDYLDRMVDISDYVRSKKIKLPRTRKRLHRYATSTIRKHIEDQWKDTNVKFQFLKEFRMEFDDVLRGTPGDAIEVIELILTNRKTGETQITKIKDKHFRLAIIQILQQETTQPSIEKVLRDAEAMTCCVLVARHIQQMAESDPNDALIYCTQYGTLDDLKFHFNSGHPDLNFKDKCGWCALTYACANGEYEKAKFLLQKGAQPNIKNLLGADPIAYASHYGKLDLCQLLFEFGADLNTASMDGVTPLMCAARSGHTAVASWLLENGASTELKDENGKNALDHSEDSNYGEIAKMIRQASKLK
jgi:hypothetical protein